MATSLLMRQQSIELEPRTLTLEEINCAREAALYVLSTTTPEKAVSIFTEGLKPVLNTQRDDDELDDDSDCEEENFDCGCCMRCHAGCLRVRDIATAPF
ncbi:hypothetical protein LUZ62_046511 [Rhynchospora pubera]|uniref:Uncharacterized protein n=2 Tax=Rhynchospora pubera TaxID=906938 RepID=A0AAV8C811_9POAL|nr:hypothetical protein LUZ62_086182 [Rhynchospora pubera]KAJ4795265.1 hypothetical protein LUZ62_046511 [Rhynchospora pubera]